MSINKRKAIRFKSEEPIYAIVNGVLPGDVFSESRTGCGVKFSKASILKKNDIVLIKVGKLSRVKAKVVWVKSDLVGTNVGFEYLF